MMKQIATLMMMTTLSATEIDGNVVGLSIPMPTTGEVSVYIHVPFCTKKCPYCHFFVLANQKTQMELYSQAVLKHLQCLNLKNQKVVSVYFGGGTPSLMPPEFFEQVLAFFDSVEEVTLEANPESIADVKTWRNLGINRLSLGVQSFDDTLLKYLGRSHNSSTILQAIEKIDQAGFKNLSIDLMYDLPFQTLDSWSRTLKVLPTLPLSHLSLYNLTIEPHTGFWRRKEKLTSLMPNQDLSLELLNAALDAFEQMKWHRYEISAFCRNNAYSKHNIGYWLGRPFYGIGPSAFSFDGTSRFSCVPNLAQYSQKIDKGQDPSHFHETLTPSQRAKELLALRLRVMTFFTPWHKDTQTTQVLNQWIEQGMLDTHQNQIRLNRRGAAFYDSLASQIIEI